MAAAIVVIVLAGQKERTAENDYPPQGQFLTIDGLRIHAHVEGTGPDLVLIHGASGSTRDMSFSLMGQLTDRYRVIALDRPGLGWSDRLPKGQDGLKEQALILRKAAAQLGADSPIVLGQSYGGGVALAWALDAPESVSGLVLVAAVSQPWSTGLPRFYKVTSSRLGQIFIVPLMTAFVSEDRVNSALIEIFAPQAVPEGYGDYIGAGLTLRRKTLIANADQRARLKADIIAQYERYPAIKLPVEILHGTTDTTVSFDIHAVPLSQQIEGAVLTALPGQGHMPQHTAQPDILRAIDRVSERAGLR